MPFNTWERKIWSSKKKKKIQTNKRKKINKFDIFIFFNQLRQVISVNCFSKKKFLSTWETKHFTTFASWTLLSKVVGVHNSFSHHQVAYSQSNQIILGKCYPNVWDTLILGKFYPKIFNFIFMDTTHNLLDILNLAYQKKKKNYPYLGWTFH